MASREALARVVERSTAGGRLVLFAGAHKLHDGTIKAVPETAILRISEASRMMPRLLSDLLLFHPDRVVISEAPMTVVVHAAFVPMTISEEDAEG